MSEIDAYMAGRAAADAEAAAQDAIERKAEPEGVTSDGATATIVSAVGEGTTTAEELVEARGFSLAEWEIERAIISEWWVTLKLPSGVTKSKNYQLKVTLRRKQPLLILPARTDGPIFRPRSLPAESATQLVAILPDQQVYGSGLGYDPKLHELVCHWLERNRPDRVVLSGDGLDCQQITQHETRPAWQRALSEAVAAWYGLLRDYVSAALGADWDYVPGNHEARIRTFIQRQCQEFYDLCRAGEDLPVLSLPYLLRLDELGITWHGGTEGAYDEWPQTQVALSKYIAVRHGWLARKGSGATALATLKHLGHSIVVGHTHRQAVVFETKHEIDHEQRILCAMEAGTLAQVRGGLGYAVAPDWQPGFATLRIAPDGTFHPSLATYANGVLRWEGQQYRHRRGGVEVAA